MKNLQLGKRLAVLASFVLPQSCIADIGTDHAYLPIYLCTHGICRAAVAVDVHAGPYQAAKETLRRLGLSDQIALRLGDGLQVVAAGEVDTVIIAGMGGTTMLDILQAKPEVTTALTRLILQPMNAAATLRQWLVQHGWYIVQEELVEEDGKLYEIIVAEPGPCESMEEVLYEIGPRLWAEQPPLLVEHVQQLIKQTERIIHSMQASAQAVSSAKYHFLMDKHRQLEDRYRWLLTQKSL